MITTTTTWTARLIFTATSSARASTRTGSTRWPACAAPASRSAAAALSAWAKPAASAPAWWPSWPTSRPIPSRCRSTTWSRLKARRWPARPTWTRSSLSAPLPWRASPCRTARVRLSAGRQQMGDCGAGAVLSGRRQLDLLRRQAAGHTATPTPMPTLKLLERLGMTRAAPQAALSAGRALALKAGPERPQRIKLPLILESDHDFCPLRPPPLARRPPPRLTARCRPPSTPSARKPLSLPRLREMHAARRKNHHADRLRRHLCRRGRCRRRRMHPGRRFAGHGLPGPAQHRRRDAGNHAPPHRMRGPRPAPLAGRGLADRRPAVWQLPRVQGAGAAQRRAC